MSQRFGNIRITALQEGRTGVLMIAIARLLNSEEIERAKAEEIGIYYPLIGHPTQHR